MREVSGGGVCRPRDEGTQLETQVAISKTRGEPSAQPVSALKLLLRTIIATLGSNPLQSSPTPTPPTPPSRN